VDRNDTRAALYECAESAGLNDIRALRSDIEAREQRFSVSIRVSWGSLSVEESAESARVTTDIRRTIPGASARDVQTWQFELVGEEGWRVCRAKLVS
jgi:hypothetical protein